MKPLAVMDFDRSRALRLASALLALGSIVAMGMLAIARGPWLDEFFTIWMADPTIPFGHSYRERWATDMHPPLYYASVWGLRSLLPDDLALLRLANALPLLIVVPTILAWRARRPADPWGAVFLGLVCCCPYFVSYFAELRSYFDVICITAALVAQLRILRWHDEEISWRDWRFGTLLALTIVVALNLHFTASAVVAILIGFEFLRLAWLRRWRSAALLAIPTALGLLLLVLSLAYLLTKTQPFALFSAGPLAYAKVIAMGAALGFALNPGVDLALLSAFMKRGRPNLRGAGWSVAGLAAAMAFLFAQGLIGNSLTLRYALVLIPPAAALAADLASDALAESRVRIGLFFASGMALLIAVTAHEVTNRRWLAMAEPIAATVRSCPETRVIGVDNHMLIPPDKRQPVAGATEVYAVGYGWVAARFGFDVEVTRGDADTIVVPGRCPTLVWSAHDMGNIPDPRELMRQARIRFPANDPQVVAERRSRDQRLIVLSAVAPVDPSERKSRP